MNAIVIIILTCQRCAYGVCKVCTVESLRYVNWTAGLLVHSPVVYSRSGVYAIMRVCTYDHITHIHVNIM